MQPTPVLEQADRYEVYQALDRRSRHALGRAAAVEELRNEGLSRYREPLDKRRKPFRWSVVARFMGLLTLLSICISPTAQSVSVERGAVIAWFYLALMVALAFGGWLSLRDGEWSYRETCVGAYYGTLNKSIRNVLFSTISIGSGEQDDAPEWLRVRDAQRWARWMTLVAMTLVIMLACALCATILDCLWDARLVTTVRPMTAFAVTTRVYEEVLWTLANSVPVLDLPNALHWANPAPFRDSLIVDITLLLTRVAVFGPVIGWLITAFRSAGFDPRQPAASDDVADKVVRGLNSFDRVTSALSREDELIADQLIGVRVDAGLDGRGGDAWAWAINFASQALGEEWPPDRVLAYLAALPAQSIR